MNKKMFNIQDCACSAEITPELWERIPKSEKDIEGLSSISLSYWQDVMLRMKKNRLALAALFFVVFILLAAIFVPFFWPLTYDQQNLAFANLPPLLSIFPVNNNECVMITPTYEAILVSRRGDIIGPAQNGRKDLAKKRTIYQIAEKQLTIDYSAYTEAKKELKQIENALKKKQKQEVQIKEAAFLKKARPDLTDDSVLSIGEVKEIVENEIPRMTATLDGQALNSGIKVWNRRYILGTDNLGRDLFIRIVYGARVSLLVGFFAALINLLVGVLYGGIAGYSGSRIDNIMMRFVDIIDAVPMTLYVILIMVIVGPGLKSIILSLGLTYWVGMARLVRGQVLSLKQQEFVKAARVIGASTKRIILRHLVPNIMGPIMVSLSMQIPGAIFTEAFLSFIGLGVSAPQASWGTLANDALASIYIYPYQMFLPAIAISLTVLSFNLFSDGLRDALDPKQRK